MKTSGIKLLLRLTAIVFILRAIETNLFQQVYFYFNSSFSANREWFPRFFWLTYPVLLLLLPIIGGFILVYILKRQLNLFEFYIYLFVGIQTFIFLFFHLRLTEILSYLVVLQTISLLLYLARSQEELAIKIRSTVIHGFSLMLDIRIILYSLIIVLCGVRIWLLFFSDNAIHVDASCRIFFAEVWASYYIPSRNWLRILMPLADWQPLHFYFSGLILLLTKSEFCVRFIHVFFGVLTSLFIYKTGRFFLNQNNSLITAISYLAYPASIILSTQVLSEPLFLFFLAVSVYFFLKIIKYQKTNSYVAFSIAINCCSLLRYEGWLLPFFFLIAYLSVYKSINKRIIFYSATGLMTPILSLFLISKLGFHPLRGLLESDIQVRYCFLTIDNIPLLFYKEYKPAWIPLGLSFFLMSIFIPANKYFKAYWVLTIIFLGQFVYKSITLTLFPQFRYLIYYETLFLFSSVYALDFFFSHRFKYSSYIVLLLMITLVTFGHVKDFWKSGPQYPQGFQNSINYMNSIHDTADIIIEYSECPHVTEWIAQTKLPIVLDHRDWFLEQYIDSKLINSIVLQKKAPRKITFWVNDFDFKFNQINRNHLKESIQTASAKFIVLFPNSQIEKSLHTLTMDKRRKLILVFSENDYKIYKYAASPFVPD